MKPILMDFPHQFETERLLIRMPQYGDGKKIYEALIYSHESLKQWLPFAQKQQTEDEVEEEVREAHIRFLKRTNLRMYLFDKATDEFIGSSGYHNINWEVPRFEIGYWIDSRYEGKGYMTEAVDGLTAFAFDHLKAKRVEIRCDALNIKSMAIPKRLGYELEGILKHESLSMDKNHTTDTMIFAKTTL